MNVVISIVAQYTAKLSLAMQFLTHAFLDNELMHVMMIQWMPMTGCSVMCIEKYSNLVN